MVGTCKNFAENIVLANANNKEKIDNRKEDSKDQNGLPEVTWNDEKNTQGIKRGVSKPPSIIQVSKHNVKITYSSSD